MLNITENTKQNRNSRLLSGKKLIIIVCATLSTGVFAQTNKIIKTSKEVSLKTNELNETAQNAKSAIEDTKEAIDASKVLLTTVFGNKKKKETSTQESVKAIQNEGDKTFEPVTNTVSMELYELVKRLTPDSEKAVAIGDWKAGATSASSIKWTSATPQTGTIGYYKQGTMENTSIFLTGNNLTGFNEIQISTQPPMENDEYSYKIEKLFGSNQYTAKLIKANNEFANPTYYYEVKLPGKKPVWIILMIESMRMSEGEERGSSLEIICLFDKKEFERRVN